MKNPERSEEKLSNSYMKKIAYEPDENVRMKKTKRTILEEPSEHVRGYLYQLYGGKCQICGKRFPMRKNGKPFFIANYIVERKLARFVDTADNALCLCPEHFAKWEHGSIEVDFEDLREKLYKFKTKKEGVSDEFTINIKLCGKDCIIAYKERHVFDLQQLLKIKGN